MGIAVKLGSDRYHLYGLGCRHRVVSTNCHFSVVVARDGSANQGGRDIGDIRSTEISPNSSLANVLI